MAETPEAFSAKTRTEISDRRRQVAEMYLQGMYQSQIAEKLGTTQPTISRDLTELRKEWLERSINNFDQKRAIELAKIDRLEVTYWEAWEASRQDFTETITDLTGNPGEQGHVQATRGRRHIRTYHRDGNPIFLQGVLDCIKKRCELLGLDAPKKQFNFDLSSLDDEQLERIAAGEDLSNVLKRGTPPSGG